MRQAIERLGRTLGWTALAVLLGTGAARAQPGSGGLWEGKVKTDRSIIIEVVVQATARQVYDLWLSPAGIQGFFAPAARIDPEVGGRYEMLFDPQGDPEGEREGTKGTRILALEPGSFLAFEWKGRASMTEMNARPFPTWVELRFSPVAGQPGRTQVSFAHYGFGNGGNWDLAYTFFAGAWRAVLDGLGQYCARLNEKKEAGGTPNEIASTVTPGIRAATI